MLLDESIEMNIALTAMQVQGQFLRPGGFSALRLADEAGIREHALEVIEDLDIRCTGPEPVSYTHLDVYKRQSLGRMLRPQILNRRRVA